MIFEQYYLECLSQASYLVADETSGRAVVVDPRRDIEQYLESAEQHGVTIELVVDTHFHADFLSGHLELAQATSAQIAFGARAKPEFAALGVRDGERISLGQVTLEVLETPGHTPESISIVVYEHPDDKVPYGVVTGDTLFIGDVGRPDLLSSLGTTSEELANMLYDSLTDKLMTLPDATRVFPGHGAGSACGKNMSTDLTSTIGRQRAVNYALQPMSRADFVHVVTEGQASTPTYFGYDARRNREAHELLHEHERPVPLSIDQLEILDPVRPTVVYCASGYRSSIAASLLRHAGFDDVSDVLGGYHAWEAAQRAQVPRPDTATPPLARWTGR
jgi:glyoxylase-like metal-dependent hydrolase (beta-lactamase superfamily II)